MEHRDFYLNVLKIHDRLRDLDESKVENIAASMGEIGLQQPISVWVSKDGAIIELVAGAHRVAAAKKLGWDKIDCIVVKMDELDRQLWEIDENLCRADLTELERAQHTSRRAELIRTFEQKSVFAKSAKTISGQSQNAQRGQGKFVADTAKKTGRSKRSVEADKARGTKIAPDVQKEIAGTDIADSGVQLDALAKATHNEQRQAVKVINLGHAKDVREVLPEAEGKKHKKRRTKAEIRLDDFDHAIQTISSQCYAWEMINVPNLDSKRRSRALAELRNAGKIIQDLIKSIQNARDENQAP